MRAEGQYPGPRDARFNQHLRGRNRIRHARWPPRRALLSLPGRQQRALNQIAQALVAEDPGLGLRFAFFARLTQHEAIPENEQVPRRLQRFLRSAIMPPLLAISLINLLAASLLIAGSSQACQAGPNAAAHASPSLGRTARCQPGPAINLDMVPVH
jgi:hypothetical protein